MCVRSRSRREGGDGCCGERTIYEQSKRKVYLPVKEDSAWGFLLVYPLDFILLHTLLHPTHVFCLDSTHEKPVSQKHLKPKMALAHMVIMGR